MEQLMETGIGKVLRIILIVLTAFLGLTAMLGGLALVANFYAPPVEQLEGSIFNNFVIPGLALLVVVGGSGALAAYLLIRKSRFALLAAVAAGFIIMFFEFVEVLSIGSPPGAALMLQLVYYGLGTLIVATGMGAWLVEILQQGK
jgi:hypothetical protein